MSIEARRVADKKDFQTFLSFPWKLYADYEYWVPELVSLRRNTLDKTKHAAWEYMTGEYFIAWRGTEPLGTLAAFVNHRHNEYHEENIGFFGFFACVDDQAVAAALFEAGEAYLREQGVSAIRGPANFNSNETYGLLVDSFDQYPMVLMPYNPAYYMRLLENQGYQPVMDLFSWRLDTKDIPGEFYEADGTTEKRLIRATRRSMERHGITVRNFNMADKQAEFQRLRALYHAAWEKNWGFVPMTDRELDNLVADLGMLLIPEFTFMGEVKGEPAGFLLLVPNFNEVMHHAGPHPSIPEPLTLLRVLWHWKLRPKVTSLRAVLMGVKAEYHGLGVEAAMHLILAEQLMAQDKIQWSEASWVLETNTPTNKLLAHFGSHMHRRHRLYEKSIQSS